MGRITGARNKHPRRLWTPEEDRILRSMYYRYGAQKTAEALTKRHAPRSVTAVATRARQILHRTGLPDNHVPLVDVDPYTSGGKAVAHWRIVNAASQDGVLQKVRTMHAWTFTAPTTWCDQYLERLADAQRYATWLPTREVAHLFGVPVTNVRDGLRPNAQLKIKPYLEGIPRVIPYPARQGYVWEPASARQEANAWHAKTALRRAA